VGKKIREFAALDLPLDMICTSHGVVWRRNPSQIVERYLEWSQDYKENQVTIAYDTMWNSTRVMAENIARGIREGDSELNVKLLNCAKTDKNDLLTEIFKSKALVLGSPTINRGILTSVAALLAEIKGLSFQDKKAAAFGSYGWSGESTKVLGEALTEAGLGVVDEGLRVPWSPDEGGKARCADYGKRLAKTFS